MLWDLLEMLKLSQGLNYMTHESAFLLAKKVYQEIYKATCDLQEKYKIFASLPPWIEIDGVIFQVSQCLDSEWVLHTKLGAAQMQRVQEGKTIFYTKTNKSLEN